MANPLEAIVIEQTAEPRELPRLTAAQVFIHYLRIGNALARAKEALDKVPEASPQTCSEQLKQIMQHCEVAGKAAARLLEANR